MLNLAQNALMLHSNVFFVLTVNAVLKDENDEVSTTSLQGCKCSAHNITEAVSGSHMCFFLCAFHHITPNYP